jgi:hypothetical protein
MSPTGSTVAPARDMSDATMGALCGGLSTMASGFGAVNEFAPPVSPLGLL